MKNDKNKNQVNLLDAITYEYIFVISSKEMEADVRIVRHKVHNLIGLSGQVLDSFPHISLYYFYSAGDIDSILKKSLQALSGIKSFPVKLDGKKFFGSEQFGKTMYIKVGESDALHNLQGALQMAFLENGEKLDPHLTVARGSRANKYVLIEQSLSEVEYCGEFDCQQITLLRKRLGEEAPYQRVRIINLEG